MTQEIAPIAVKGVYRGAAIIHYSKLRGLNDYSSYKNVIVIGSEPPPEKAMVALAKGI